MKTKILHIKFQSLEEFRTEGRNAIKTHKTSIQKEDELFFSSVVLFERFFTPQKYRLLALIRALQPNSIYQLAQFADRDFANVSRDCYALEAVGFINLTTYRDGDREIKKPELIFDYNKIEVHIPERVHLDFRLAKIA